MLFKEPCKGKNNLSFTDTVAIDNLLLLPTSTPSISEILVAKPMPQYLAMLVI